MRTISMNISEKFIANLRESNVQCQKGLIEMFDSTVGRSTVLMPFGGTTQRSETQVSVQKLPVGNHYTDTASMMAYGYNPDISLWSPYHGAQYAVVEAIAKIVAAGGRRHRIRFSFQEYFEKMTENPFSWGKPTAALLGALQMQHDFCLPAIGGKDSMSGTFGNIDVPPMLMAIGITTVDAGNVISTDLKRAGNRLYCVWHRHRPDYTPDVDELKRNFDFVADAIASRRIVSAWAVGAGGVAEGICKMAFGNRIGADLTVGGSFSQEQLFALSYGSIIVEASEALSPDIAIHIGYTTEDPYIIIRCEQPDGNTSIEARLQVDELYKVNTERFARIYPLTSDGDR